jgi:hypothetical protein
MANFVLPQKTLPLKAVQKTAVLTSFCSPAKLNTANLDFFTRPSGQHDISCHTVVLLFLKMTGGVEQWNRYSLLAG